MQYKAYINSTKNKIFAWVKINLIHPPPFKAEDYLEKEAHSVLCIMYLCFILIY